MSAIVNGITHGLEALLVFLATFTVAAVIMSSFGGIAPTEVWLAFVEAILAVVIWTRYIQRPV